MSDIKDKKSISPPDFIRKAQSAETKKMTNPIQEKKT